MVNARSLLVFSTVSFGLVTLQGGSGGCGGGASVASCTADGVAVTLLPGDCAPIPACDKAGYFSGSGWALDAPTIPSYLSIRLRPLAGAGGTVDVANVCANSDAPKGSDFSGSIVGKAPILGGGGEFTAETKLTVHIRGESSMNVQLAVDGAPVLNGRTLVSAGRSATVQAAAVVGSLNGREGKWFLVSSNADLVVMSASSGKGSLMTPAVAQLTDLVLQLYKPGTTEPSDDVFSLPVRIMEDGGAAVTVRQLESTYRGIPCPGMTESPTCEAQILCFSAAGSLLNWPSGASTMGRSLGASMLPTPPPDSLEWKREGDLFAACPGSITSLEYSVLSGGTVLDSFKLAVQ